MATIRRGKRKGETVRVHQWENDWFSVDYADGRPGIITPTSLELTDDEADAWLARPGNMPREFALSLAPPWRFARVRSSGAP